MRSQYDSEIAYYKGVIEDDRRDGLNRRSHPQHWKYRNAVNSLKYLESKRRQELSRAHDNPVSGVDNVVGTFVSEHPWLSALIGTAALGAAGWTGAYLMSLAIGPSKSKAIVPSTDNASNPKSTSTSTSTTTSPSTSTTTSTSTTPSTPTFDAAKVVTLTIPSGGKEIPVGTSLQVIDAHTGLPVAGECSPLSVLVPGPTDGTYVAIAAGSAKIYPVSGAEASVPILVTPAATAGVAGLPKRLPPKRAFGFRSLLPLGA